MISIASVLFDPDGQIGLQELPESDTGEVRRRINRIKTLNGGAVVNDAGHSAADRTFDIRWRVTSESQYRQVQRLVRLHARVTVATRESIFLAAPESVVLRNGRGELRLLVLEQMA